jgi:predicted flap endonuclease-1-like 5' DNA nuclease
MIDKKLFLDRNRTVTFGIFENSDKFLETVGKIHSSGANIIDCYSPFPIHGIEKAMGLKRSLLPIGAFICGCIGFSLAATMMLYMMHFDWPIIIGNKPTVGVSYVPVLFESTVLLTAFGIAILFFIRNKMLHGKLPSERVDMRQTDDRMIVAIATDGENVNKSEITNWLYNGGAVEVKERINHGYEDFEDVVIEKSGNTASKLETKVAKSSEVDNTVIESVKLTEAEKIEKTTALLNIIGSSDGDKDAIIDIKGIGEVYEGKLNGLGIFTFKQIANLTPEAIQLVESITEYFPGKIEREDWIGQAKEFLNNKNNNGNA